MINRELLPSQIRPLGLMICLCRRGAWRKLLAENTIGFVEAQRFALVRQVLEALEDIPALADVSTGNEIFD